MRVSGFRVFWVFWGFAKLFGLKAIGDSEGVPYSCLGFRV